MGITSGVRKLHVDVHEHCVLCLLCSYCQLRTDSEAVVKNREVQLVQRSVYQAFAYNSHVYYYIKPQTLVTTGYRRAWKRDHTRMPKVQKTMYTIGQITFALFNTPTHVVYKVPVFSIAQSKGRWLVLKQIICRCCSDLLTL